MSTAAEPLSRLLEVLDRLEIAYEIGGSVASSAHGIPRTTLDVELIVDLSGEKIDDFVAELREDFYADAPIIREAFARGRAANLIHMGTALKFDLFPLRDDAYSRSEFSKRLWREIRFGERLPIECAIASAEDTVLRKLEWYRVGGESSERQWNDVVGVCRSAGRHLDQEYLVRWATSLRVDDLLVRLLAESTAAP